MLRDPSDCHFFALIGHVLAMQRCTDRVLSIKRFLIPLYIASTWGLAVWGIEDNQRTDFLVSIGVPTTRARPLLQHWNHRVTESPKYLQNLLLKSIDLCDLLIHSFCFLHRKLRLWCFASVAGWKLNKIFLVFIYCDFSAPMLLCYGRCFTVSRNKYFKIAFFTYITLSFNLINEKFSCN